MQQSSPNLEYLELLSILSIIVNSTFIGNVGMNSLLSLVCYTQLLKITMITLIINTMYVNEVTVIT